MMTRAQGLFQLAQRANKFEQTKPLICFEAIAGSRHRSQSTSVGTSASILGRIAAAASIVMIIMKEAPQIARRTRTMHTESAAMGVFSRQNFLPYTLSKNPSPSNRFNQL